MIPEKIVNKLVSGIVNTKITQGTNHNPPTCPFCGCSDYHANNLSELEHDSDCIYDLAKNIYNSTMSGLPFSGQE